MYIDRLDLLRDAKAFRIIHFAPEHNISRRILSCEPLEYIKADLFPQSADVQQVDMTNMQFEDASFDLLIANHVLEHIPDDVKAISEVNRVLKPGGFAILQTPFSSILYDSFSDPSIDTDELRLRFYGQEDHVRVYGADLFRKITEAGFELDRKKHEAVLSDFDPHFCGVNAREDLILARKPGTDNAF